MAAVASCLQNADKHVVHDKSQRAGKINTEIRHRKVKHLRRSPHPDQNLRRQYHAHHRQNQTGYQSQRDDRMHRPLHALRVFRAIITRDDHAGAQRDAVKKADQQINQIPRRADRRQRFAAQKITDDQRIDRVVQLLKQVAEKDRHGEKDNFFPDRPLCHQTPRL